MREIKFRGKWVDNGEWVYGDLLRENGKCYICFDLIAAQESFKFEVIPETVGQYTGLCTRGLEIYEGDIVRYHYEYYSESRVAEVVFDLGMFAVKEMNDLERRRGVGGQYIKLCSLNRVEVIGDVHTNTELLEVTK